MSVEIHKYMYTHVYSCTHTHIERGRERERERAEVRFKAHAPLKSIDQTEDEETELCHDEGYICATQGSFWLWISPDSVLMQYAKRSLNVQKMTRIQPRIACLSPHYHYKRKKKS